MYKIYGLNLNRTRKHSIQNVLSLYYVCNTAYKKYGLRPLYNGGKKYV